MESERLCLRPLEMKHVDALLELRVKNKEFLRFWEPERSGLFFTRQQQQLLIRQAMYAARSDEAYSFGIFKQPLDELIGRISLSGVVRGVFQNAYLGYFIDQAHNGQGYATEAVRFLVVHAFAALGLHRIQAAVMPRNFASQRVLEKSSFRLEGQAEQYLKINGVWEDHLMYARTAEDLAREHPGG